MLRSEIPQKYTFLETKIEKLNEVIGLEKIKIEKYLQIAEVLLFLTLLAHFLMGLLNYFSKRINLNQRR